MADKAPQDRPGSGPDHESMEQGAAVPIRLVRGKASLEELSALIAVVAVLSSAAEDESDESAGPDNPAGLGRGTSSRSRWGSPARLLRRTHPQGPEGWRSYASPRADTFVGPGD